MEFSKVGKHTFKCVISEQEINGLGYTLDDIMSNGEKTQEFMNHIFDLAEQKFQTHFELGIKSVRADFLSDHTISLTFSEQANDSNMIEHLKDLVGNLLEGMVPKPEGEKKEETEKTQSPREMIDNFKMPEGVKIDVMFLFEDIETLARFAKLVDMNPIPENALYRFEELYFLQMDLTNSSEEDVKRLSLLTDEYALDIVVGEEKRAMVEEHGEAILKTEALETLKQL